MTPDKDGPAPFLTLARFRLYLRVQTLMVLPPYKGAVFRGALGSSLRHLMCVARQPDCCACLLRDRCLYISLFDPPPPPDYPEARKFKYAPRPYVLIPPLNNRTAFRPGEFLNFDLVLFGSAVDNLHYFLYIFEEMGRRGLGPERGKYKLLKVDILRDGQSNTIFNCSTRSVTAFTPDKGLLLDTTDASITSVTLNFLTPLRLKLDGDLVTQLSFPIFFENLTRRLKLISAFYGSRQKLPNLTPLTAQASYITATPRSIHWYDWGDYSNRNQASRKYGGLVGRIDFNGSLSPFLPYLQLGEKIHVGQSTTQGLGKFTLIY